MHVLIGHYTNGPVHYRSSRLWTNILDSVPVRYGPGFGTGPYRSKAVRFTSLLTTIDSSMPFTLLSFSLIIHRRTITNNCFLLASHQHGCLYDFPCHDACHFVPALRVLQSSSPASYSLIFIKINNTKTSHKLYLWVHVCQSFLRVVLKSLPVQFRPEAINLYVIVVVAKFNIMNISK